FSPPTPPPPSRTGPGGLPSGAGATPPPPRGGGGGPPTPPPTPQTLTFDLSRFTTVTGGSSGLVPRWNTVTTGGGDLYTPRSDLRLNGKSVAVPFAAKSVQTLQIDNVTP
ncbi:hypothetical protein ACIGAQ_10000, partial [Streptomyces sp. NPDC085932]